MWQAVPGVQVSTLLDSQGIASRKDTGAKSSGGQITSEHPARNNTSFLVKALFLLSIRTYTWKDYGVEYM